MHPQMHVHTCTPYGKVVEWNQLSGSLLGTQQIFRKHLVWQAERKGTSWKGQRRQVPRPSWERAREVRYHTHYVQQKLQEQTRQSMKSEVKKDRELFWSMNYAGLYTYELMTVLAGLFYMVCFWDTVESETLWLNPFTWVCARKTPSHLNIPFPMFWAWGGGFTGLPEMSIPSWTFCSLVSWPLQLSGLLSLLAMMISAVSSQTSATVVSYIS